MVFAKWFFVGLNHPLKIVHNAPPLIWLFLNQDIWFVVFRKGRSLDRCYSHCISPWWDIISAHGLDAMIYADDTQLLIFMRIWNRAVALENLGLFSDDIMSWNLCSMLKCRPSKTEMFHFFSHFSPAEPIASIKVGYHYVQPPGAVTDVGVTPNSHFPFVHDVSNTYRALFHSFHSIGRIRKYILQVDTERIVHALVCSLEFLLVKLRNFRDCRTPR